MKNILLILQIIVALMLCLAILLQAKGTGLGTVFGGSEGVYRSKRGMEKLLVYLTVFLAFLFLVFSISYFLIK